MTPAEPRIAFCTTAKGRLQHVEQTLPRNLADNADYPNLVIVLVDYQSDDGLADYIRRAHQADLESGRLVYYRYDDAPTFRMAHAKNMAHRLALAEGARILANIDADNFTGPGFASAVAAKFRTAADEDEAIFLRCRDNHRGPGGSAAERTPPGCHGRIVVTAGAFLQAGGYDEYFAGWGPDDLDFAMRLLRLGYMRHGLDRSFRVAIKHNDKLRFSKYGPGAPKTREEAASNFRLDGRQHLSVVNNGHIGEGVVFRNFEPKPVHIRRLPTRIFGIGMHKTATTSLAKALQVLGFDCAHWESPQWAKRIVEEMLAEGRSLTLEAHYAATDFPIAWLYRELDRAYPGSKFILTLRDERDWVTSAQHHWKRYSKDWPGDGFSNDMHWLVYGRSDFDAEAFLKRYRRHNREVVEYFKGRDDLLVMDMSAGAGWRELCGFFKRPIPGRDYPLEYVTEPIVAPPDYPC